MRNEEQENVGWAIEIDFVIEDSLVLPTTLEAIVRSLFSDSQYGYDILIEI